MAAAVLVAVMCFLLATLPRKPIALSVDGADPELVRRTIRGAHHIHTSRSDGADAKAVIATAAARAGLQFAIFADHGDGTRQADPPAYIDGVLCIDAVEISTTGGHYIAIGMRPAPYPLGGEASAVVEDVRRLGGFGIAAHPDHPVEELAWRDWSAPIDGLEWLNADSEWRTEEPLALVRTLFDYILRPAPAIASVLDRPVSTLERWDRLSRDRRVTALAAVDAHGWGAGSTPEDGGRRISIGPTYEASFRTLTNRVILDRTPSGDATTDARALLEALRRGSVYSVVDAIARDVFVELDPASPGVRSALPAGAAVSAISGESASRLEVQTPDAPGDPPVPWVLTNWVYREEPRVPPEQPQDAGAPPTVPIVAGEWRVEQDQRSTGDVLGTDAQVRLRFALAPGSRGNQFVAAAADIRGGTPPAALAFRGRASRPMRVSVQLRYPPDDRRWRKSIYLDTEEREVVFRVGEMVPAEPSNDPGPRGASPRSILFVVDLVNARPGDTGEFTVGQLRAR